MNCYSVVVIFTLHILWTVLLCSALEEQESVQCSCLLKGPQTRTSWRAEANQGSTLETQLLNPDIQLLEQSSLEGSQIFSADPVSVAGTFRGMSVSPCNVSRALPDLDKLSGSSNAYNLPLT